MKLFPLTLLLLPSVALCQPAAPAKPATVEGKVTNSATNDPLRKVELTLTTKTEGDDEDFSAALAMFGGGDDLPVPPPSPKVEKKTYKAISDAAGKFHFDEVAHGDYYLRAVHPGFMDERYKPGASQGSEGKLHIASGDQVAGLALRMTPQGAVSGHVLDEDGDPVPNAVVSALSVSYASGHRKLISSDVTSSNDRGEFRLGKLPPGHYFIGANLIHADPTGAVPEAPKDGTAEMDYVSTYYPHALDVSAATKVDVAAAADLAGFNIQLKKSKVVRIKGQALTAEGGPLKGGQAMLMNSGNVASMQMAMLTPEGKFEIAHVQPGAYTLMLMQMGGPKPVVTMQAVLVPENGIANLKIGSQEQKTVEGRVVTAGVAKVNLKGLTVMLQGDQEAFSMPGVGVVKEDGAFTLKVAPAAYDLTLNPIPPGAYLKSVTANGREMLGKPIDTSAGAANLVISLGTDAGKVDASASLSGKPQFDATVVLLPADPNQRFRETTKQASTDEGGHVSIKDVPPGEYLVFAWEKVDDGAWFDPDYIKSLETRAGKVTVGPQSNEKIELHAIPRA